jgi:WD40 repeat protein
MIRLWNAKTGTEIRRLVGHMGSVRTLCALRDGRLASGSDDNTIRLWDVKTGTAKVYGHPSSVRALSVLPDGRLASAVNNTIILLEVKTGAETARLEGHSDSVLTLCALPDGRLASGSDDNTIRLWDVKTGAETARLETDAPIHSLIALSNDRLVAGDALGRLHWLEVVA